MERAPGWALALALGLALAPGAGRGGSLSLEECGGGPVPVPGVGNAELSGITWLGGGRFLSVDDGGRALVPLEIALAEGGCAIRSVTAGTPVPLAEARDPEGIATRRGHAGVLVVDEGTRDLRVYDPETGKLLRSFAPPALYAGRVKKNTGFESVAAAADGETVWIATEGQLRRDGRSSNGTGFWVRLQRLDAALRPAGQYAYRTEPGLGLVGVVDLLVTKENALLVLERALTGGGLSARIFAADVSQATDVSSFEKLRNRSDFHAVRKEKLWERSGGFQNFEGMALGPELAGGARLVLLVSDGGDRRPPALLALRLAPRPAPGTAAR